MRRLGSTVRSRGASQLQGCHNGGSYKARRRVVQKTGFPDHCQCVAPARLKLHPVQCAQLLCSIRGRAFDPLPLSSSILNVRSIYAENRLCSRRK